MVMIDWIWFTRVLGGGALVSVLFGFIAGMMGEDGIVVSAGMGILVIIVLLLMLAINLATWGLY